MLVMAIGDFDREPLADFHNFTGCVVVGAATRTGFRLERKIDDLEL